MRRPTHPCRSLRILIAILGLTLMFWATSHSSMDPQVSSASRIPNAQFEGSSLKLIGTVVSTSPDQNLAIIADQRTGRQWVFHEGERAGRFVIKEIERDRMIIDAGNGDQVVRMRRFLTGRSLALTPAEGKVSPIDEKLTSIEKQTPALRERHYALDSENINDALANPDLLAKSMEIAPGRFLNHQTGFRIFSFSKHSIFSKMGLRKGDLLLTINDQTIRGPEEASSVFTTIRDEAAVNLTVRRRARTYTIHLHKK